MTATPLLRYSLGEKDNGLEARRRLRALCRQFGLEPQQRAMLGVALTQLLRSLRPPIHVLVVLESDSDPALVVEVQGRTPADLDRLHASRRLPVNADVARLIDAVSIDEPGPGELAVRMRSRLSQETVARLPVLARRLPRLLAQEVGDELDLQQAEISEVVAGLVRRERDVARMEEELEKTNRGVLALYAELDEAARQWHTTFDSISDGVCLLDPEGRIVRVNDSILRLLESPLDDVAGQLAAEVVGRRLGAVDMPGMIPSLAAGRRRQVAEVRAGDRWYTLTLDVIASVGLDTVAGGVLILSDITERKRLEDERRLAERMENETVQLRQHASRMRELERMKSDFLNLASHELRGPLSVLRGYVSMFADGSLGDLTDSMKLVVPVMTSKVREMNTLINQMLETARLEDSRLVLNLEPVDLREVIADAAQSMRPVAADHHHLRLRPGPRSVVVHGDRNRLTTILTNLIDNAIKYSPHGGDVHCELVIGDRRAEIRVRDSGLGIDEEDMPKLFTRFGRLVNSRNSHIPGTGLGLYLSRELARMHGGDIVVASHPTRGSTFSLMLPILDQAEGGSPTVPAEEMSKPAV